MTDKTRILAQLDERIRTMSNQKRKRALRYKKKIIDESEPLNPRDLPDKQSGSHPGIYYLLSGHEIVYVGRSRVNVYVHIYDHAHPEKLYDSYYYHHEPDPKKQKVWLAGAVMHFSPKYNDVSAVPVTSVFAPLTRMAQKAGVDSRELGCFLNDLHVNMMNGIVDRREARKAIKNGNRSRFRKLISD